jgi:hypothetical protein
MGCRQVLQACGLSLVAAVAHADVRPSPAVPLARRIDLTTIQVVEADYEEAMRHHNKGNLEVCEAAVWAMLHNQVLPFREDGNASTGSGGYVDAHPPSAQAEDSAPDENEAVVSLAQQFLSLQGKYDDDSMQRKVAIMNSFHALSERANYKEPETEE